MNAPYKNAHAKITVDSFECQAEKIVRTHQVWNIVIRKMQIVLTLCPFYFTQRKSGLSWKSLQNNGSLIKTFILFKNCKKLDSCKV